MKLLQFMVFFLIAFLTMHSVRGQNSTNDDAIIVVEDVDEAQPPETLDGVFIS